MKSLEGKIAVVTGAGRGIGGAIAIGYAKAGAAVCCISRKEAEIDNTVTDIEKMGAKGLAIPATVTQLDAVVNLFAQAGGKFGGIDIVCINAGTLTVKGKKEDALCFFSYFENLGDSKINMSIH